ncbi:hypothetical protein SAY87_022665 [Trapa incisa]|uniref:Mediator of RNA polymerase II transcription subunit 4 n=1 Tax=Trapa incisa TaxID=236973 RepID=A0AAN7K4I2_9MYRT|nr:hypothetical protein SAY87_022665 [Trapa incisa]
MLQQIAQSPARLGLTSPNSPSLQSPPTQPPPKFSSAPPQTLLQPLPNLATAPSTSSSLLPLLPPLPRAQSLLLQMASLATRLFEVSPNRSFWLTSFRGTFPTFLPSQSQTLPDQFSSSTKEVLSLFTSLQTQLFEAVAELQEILDLQDAKQKVSGDVRSKDAALLSFAHKLKEAEKVLDVLVDDYSDYRCPKRLKSDDAEEDEFSYTTMASRLNLSDIISYAHRISYTTFAPPEFGAGQAPLRGALPPAPQDEQMRASQLYSFANLDIGLPKEIQANEKTVEPIIEPSLVPDSNNPLANFAAIQGLLPPNITVPSGWKPGMPVELPTDLPAPPPGWKPGDPIPLPPLESLAVARAVEPQLRPVPPHGLHKEPEIIQVRHVDLELPDNFDDSSDYSSDEGSSEEDD